LPLWASPAHSPASQHGCPAQTTSKTTGTEASTLASTTGAPWGAVDVSQQWADADAIGKGSYLLIEVPTSTRFSYLQRNKKRMMNIC